MKDVKSKGCICLICQVMCWQPCWPTPDEARALIKAGYGPRLMVDYWVVTDASDVLVLCPASPGREGSIATFFNDGCVFQNEDGLCALHDMGLKPIEGRLACACTGQCLINREGVMKLWDNNEAQELVEEWRTYRER